MAFFQKIVVTGNGQPPESPFYYPDKIKDITARKKLKLCLMGQKVKYDKENNQWLLVDKLLTKKITSKNRVERKLS